MKSLWAAFVLLASGPSASTASSALDAFIESELPASAAPGLAYAVVDYGEASTNAFGEKISTSNEFVTPDTSFPIGSVTKSFTALAIMQLVEAGEIKLDDPVSTILSAYANGPGSRITVRQLLNHTSGYSTVQGNSLHTNSIADELALARYVESLASLEPAHEPGTVWEYSNTNYQILGAIIEQVSGQDYANYVEGRILEPLGMTNSSVGDRAANSDTASGHRPWFGGTRVFDGHKSNPINDPAGGITASANDMALYLAMWLNKKDDVLSARGKDLMMRPSGPVSPNYGLGWFLDTEKGAVYHTGLVPGAETLASLIPDQGKGVAVMVNANGGFGFSDTWYLIGGAGAHALGLEHDDDGSRWGPMGAYLSIAILPPMFLLFILASLRGRSQLRLKKQSRVGLFGLWFPLAAMVGLAWFLTGVLPRFFGGSFATVQLYQPDFALCIVAAATLAVAWAVLRLVLAYSGNIRSTQ